MADDKHFLIVKKLKISIFSGGNSILKHSFLYK